MGILAFLAGLMSNPVFVGVGGGAIVGGLMVALRSIPYKLWKGFLHLFTVEVHIENDDDVFQSLNKYLAEHKAAKTARTLRLMSWRGSNGNSWVLGPGIGSVWFWIGWRFVIVTRNLTETKNDNGTREYIRIRMLGRSQTCLRDFIKAAEDKDEDQGKIKLKSYSGGYWQTVSKITPRAAKTVILPPDLKTNLFNDINWFKDNKQYYLDRGIPYHRGYLFSGPPGTGKSSIIPVLAGEVGRDVYYLSLSTLKDDRDLLEAVNDAPQNAIIALEDIDAATKAGDRRDEDKTIEKGVTLAGLLNVLDGGLTPEGRIFIMTSNHVEKLDPALIRPGRVDFSATFGYLSKELQEEMSLLFYDTPVSRDEPISPARMQNILMSNSSNREEAQRQLDNES